VIYFTLADLVVPEPIFSVREILIPWLREVNEPEMFIGLKDVFGKWIYEGDTVRGTIDMEDSASSSISDADYTFTDTIIFKHGAFCCEKADFELKYYDLELLEANSE